MNNLLTLHS